MAVIIHSQDLETPLMADLYDPHDPQTITEWYCCQCARYHGIPPPRYDCTRCNHMMCPYCPKRRIKDGLQQQQPLTNATAN